MFASPLFLNIIGLVIGFISLSIGITGTAIIFGLLFLSISLFKKKYKQEVTFFISEEKIRISSSNILIEYPWSTVQRIFIDKNFVGIDFVNTNRKRFVIPKRVFEKPEDLETLKLIGQAKGKL